MSNDNFNKKNNSGIDLSRGSITKQFSQYAIPSIFGMLGMTSAGIIDGIFIGRIVGSDGLAAVNLAVPLLEVFGGIGLMVAVGGGTLANIKRGAGNIEESNNFFTLTSIFTLVLGIILTVLVFFLPDEFARILGSDHVTLPLVSIYIKYISIFTIPFMFLYAFDVFLKNDGYPLFPVICTVS